MESVSGPTTGNHLVRCVRWREIDHTLDDAHGEATEPMEIGDDVLAIENMQKYYEVHDRSIRSLLSGRSVMYVRANEEITFDARRGETVAIVGESGCGEVDVREGAHGGWRPQPTERSTTTATRYREFRSGSARRGKSARCRWCSRTRSTRSTRVTPSVPRSDESSGSSVSRRTRPGSDNGVLELLDIVKLPRDFYARRPRQLSGGQKQRIGIARAFAGNPSMVIADEPVSALDVSVAAAVTELLMEIQREHKTTLLFISHDLSVVRYLSDRIVVMYLGRIMERGATEAIFAPPYHPYTEALLSAVPIADPEVTKREIVLEGNLPSALNPPHGCPFSTRCPRKVGNICDEERPPMQLASETHAIACPHPARRAEAGRAGPSACRLGKSDCNASRRTPEIPVP